MIIAKHIPALQVLIPFFGALISALSFRSHLAWLISTISIILATILSIYAMPLANLGINYSFGGWQAPIGIEYRLDAFSQPLIFFLNFVLLFLLLFGKKLIDRNVTKYIEDNRQHIFYSLLLFAHAGYIGIISTNDLFNLYVFIEISSLATYVLMSKGRSARALLGAFDYLILGTIGATLILIGIGFFFAITGSLNATDIATILKNLPSSKIAITGTVFFLVGAILKMAFFPMHFWMIRAYSAASSIVLTYLAAISSIVGLYIILRFIYFTIEIEPLQQNLSLILRWLAIATIVICTFLALKTNTIKKVVVFSTASQIGYIFLLMSIWVAQGLLLQLVILDALNKIALFTMIAHIESKTVNLSFAKLKTIENSPLFKALAALALIFSASIPLSSMFLVKIRLLDLLLESGLNLEFIIVILGSFIGLLYHMRLAKALFFGKTTNGTIQIDKNLYGFMLIIIIQFMSLVYDQNIVEILASAEMLLMGR